MTNQYDIEEYLRVVSQHLDLPADRAAQVVTELRTHLLADIAERVANGSDESTAAREAVAEMGDAGKIALGLTREDRPRMTVGRAIGHLRKPVNLILTIALAMVIVAMGIWLGLIGLALFGLPTLVGMAGGAIWKRRPRLAGAIAGLLFHVLTGPIVTVLQPPLVNGQWPHLHGADPWLMISWALWGYVGGCLIQPCCIRRHGVPDVHDLTKHRVA